MSLSSTFVEISDVSMSYGKFQALLNVDMQITPGDFVTLLGPSGSGKTSLLMAIAGLAQIDSGRIEFNNQDISRTLPENRNIGIVFQNYALFPNMSVGENIGYPLKVRRWSKSGREQLVHEALAQVRLTHLVDRKVTQLSGGQRQRVALARALVFSPSVLLMDEPLGALDKSLREGMQFEIKEIQKRLGITTVSVTHDQQEAMAMADKIAIMQDGKVEQYSSTEQIFEKPTNSFVAQFIGDTSVLHLRNYDGCLYFGDVLVSNTVEYEVSALVLRSDEVEIIHTEPQSGICFPAEVVATAYQGTDTVLHFTMDNNERIKLRCRTYAVDQISSGQKVWIKIAKPTPTIVPIQDSRPIS